MFCLYFRTQVYTLKITVVSHLRRTHSNSRFVYALGMFSLLSCDICFECVECLSAYSSLQGHVGLNPFQGCLRFSCDVQLHFSVLVSMFVYSALNTCRVKLLSILKSSKSIVMQKCVFGARVCGNSLCREKLKRSKRDRIMLWVQLKWHQENT